MFPNNVTRAHRLIVWSWVALFIASCSDESNRSKWVALAEGFQPSIQVTESTVWNTPFISGTELTVEPEEGGTGFWVTTNFPAEVWEVAPIGKSVWRARRPIWDSGAPSAEGSVPQRLENDEQSFRYIPFDKSLLGKEQDPGDFSGVLEFVYLTTAGEKPADVRYSVFVERGGMVDGRWRIGNQRFTCDGFPLWSGHTEEVISDVPANSVLRFSSTAAATAAKLGASAGQVTFRVLLDEVEVFRFEQSVWNVAHATRHRVVLPPEARTGAQIRFEVNGPAAICAVLEPILAPAEIGTPSSRPFLDSGEEPQKNVVLFLADTFRADSMPVYGAEYSKSLTPNLDAFADESSVFTRTWSPASWTLPAQASMMTGLFPLQHGAMQSKQKMANEVVTLAEIFAAAGYRTGAITDSLLVSHRFGFDQGFQWFDELKRPIGETLEETRAFLDSDDGRPFFLFIQTYRTHAPFYTTDQTRSEYAEVLDLHYDWNELNDQLKQAESARDKNEPFPDAMWDLVGDIEQLYRAGVVDLDRAFGTVLKDFDDRGFADNTWIVFTSDHGEAFGEHQQLFHGNGVWDENVRIPLVIRGPGNPVGLFDTTATLVDLPKTIVDLVGIPASPSWGGSNLFEASAERPAYSFQCPASGEPGHVTIIDGHRKIILENSKLAIEEQTLHSAYELDQDKGEQRDLLPEGESWPIQVLEKHGVELKGIRSARYQAPKSTLSPKDVQDLAAVGYTDSE